MLQVFNPRYRKVSSSEALQQPLAEGVTVNFTSHWKLAAALFVPRSFISLFFVQLWNSTRYNS